MAHGSREGSARPSLSIVIPAYNEAERLPSCLEHIAAHLGDGRVAVEILVVDDGSTDDTPGIAEVVGAELGLSLRAIRCSPNRGKGFAVRRGMLDASGDAVLFTDADLSVSIDHLDRFLARLAPGVDVVIATRLAAGARVAVRQAPFRQWLGEIFRELARWMTVREISDFTCGFKLYRRAAAQQVFSLQRLWGWGFDAEIALIAKQCGLAWVEEPVEWRDDARSKVRLVRDVIRSVLDLLRIRWNLLMGRYRASPLRRDVPVSSD